MKFNNNIEIFMKSLHLAVTALFSTSFIFGCNSSSSSSASSPSSPSSPSSEQTPPSYTVKKLSINSNGQTPATIYSSSSIEDEYVEHVANVLAGYLDNNYDGSWDNSTLVSQLGNVGASIILTEDNEDPEAWYASLPSSIKNEIQLDYTQGMIRSDIILCNQADYNACFNNQTSTQFDATYEEVLHLITTVGYSQIEPAVFAENANSTLANAMNIARDDLNGDLNDANHCQTNADGEEECNWPAYSVDAWYSYEDPTCTYACMVSEYNYWVVTSLLGIQEHRTGVDNEWNCTMVSSFEAGLCNGELDASGAIHVLYGSNANVANGIFNHGTNPYSLPTQIPFGPYQVNGQTVNWNIESF